MCGTTFYRLDSAKPACYLDHMKIHTMLAGIEGHDGGLFTVDCVFYEGMYWVVPEWLENPSEGWKKPARIVALDFGQYQKAGIGGHDLLYQSGSIPKSVYDEKPDKRFRVINLPDLKFPCNRA